MINYLAIKVGVLYSGGKDSTYALHWAYLQGLEIACLISARPKPESMLLHYPGIEVTKIQAKAMGLDIVSRELQGNEEEELYGFIKYVVREYGIEGLVAGALLSDFQRMRFSFIAERLGLKVYTPLWRINQWLYMNELIEIGIKFILTSVSAYGLKTSYIGKIIDYELLKKIFDAARKYKLNPAFEGGEAETLVVDAPLFKRKLVITGEIIERSEYDGEFLIKSVDLGDQPRVTIMGRRKG